MSRRTLGLLLVLELAVGVVLIGLRTSRPAAPKLNLERMPPPSARDLESLCEAADRGGAASWSEYGQACLASGYLLEAEAVLQHALTLDSDQAESRWFLARTREKLGDVDGAISEYQRILSMPATGREAICWYRTGRNHLRAERSSEAESAFQRAGNYPAALIEQTRLRLRAGELQEAGRLIQELQKQRIPDVYVEMLAVELSRLGKNPLDLAKALERLERSHGVLESQREWHDVELIRSNLGLERRLVEISQLRAKQPAGALQAFRALLAEIPPAFADPFSPIVMQLALQARDVQALDALKAHYEQRLSLPPLAQHYVAQAYWESHDEKRVEAASRQANSLMSMTETCEHLARMAAFRRDSQEEREMLALALSVEGTTQYQIGELKRASEMLQQSISMNPRADAWFYLAEIELGLGNIEHAQEAYQRCLELNPRFGRARERLAAIP